MNANERADADLISRLPDDVSTVHPAIVVRGKKRRTLIFADEQVVLLGVTRDGHRSSDTLVVGYGAVSRVLWEAVAILDEYRVTVRFTDGEELTIATERSDQWSSIRGRLAGSTTFAPWPIGRTAERVGGFLHANALRRTMPILYVDTDGVTLGDEEHVYSPDVHAVLAFRAPDASIKRPLFEQLLNRSESGQAYVTITADTWKIDMPIRTKNMHQASTLVDRINELAAESGTSHG